MLMLDSYYVSLYLQELQCVSKDSRIINSVLEGEVHVAAGAVVQHCHLQVRRASSLFNHFLVYCPLVVTFDTDMGNTGMRCEKVLAFLVGE